MINVYCQDRGWLFEDLKKAISSYGAVASEYPIDADAYICIRSNEAKLSPKPNKTVVQVHDMETRPLNGYGCVSFVHPAQKRKWKGFTGNSHTQPIGSRIIPMGSPSKPTIGFFCREVNGKKRSDLFGEVVKRLKGDFDILMIGDKLDHIAHLGRYERRAATPDDYKRITHFVTTSVSKMVPLSAYEALSIGKVVVSTPREWPFSFKPLQAETAEGLADFLDNTIDHFGVSYKPFDRMEWAKKQVELAKCLLS